MNLRTRTERKNQPELPFPKPQGGPTRDRDSLERRERVLIAMKDFYRGRRK